MADSRKKVSTLYLSISVCDAQLVVSISEYQIVVSQINTIHVNIAFVSKSSMESKAKHIDNAHIDTQRLAIHKHTVASMWNISNRLACVSHSHIYMCMGVNTCARVFTDMYTHQTLFVWLNVKIKYTSSYKSRRQAIFCVLFSTEKKQNLSFFRFYHLWLISRCTSFDYLICKQLDFSQSNFIFILLFKSFDWYISKFLPFIWHL